jgi:formate hydrogenlyase subunit 3/multisubunit Na+/H+ antiporter MnhD subunit
VDLRIPFHLLIEFTFFLISSSFGRSYHRTRITATGGTAPHISIVLTAAACFRSHSLLRSLRTFLMAGCLPQSGENPMQFRGW